jgi:energy-coupling factor transporter ATP-binding protein EcfA2
MDARNEMELPEDAIRRHYRQALSLLSGFDHAPRLVREAETGTGSDDALTRPTGRQSATGFAHGATTRTDRVRLLERIENAGGDDLLTPAAATMARVLRRATAIALAVADEVAARSGAAALKRRNTEHHLPHDRHDDFAQLVAVESLAALSVLANATAFLLSEHAGARSVADASADEILTDSPIVALQGALWELDRNLAQHAKDDDSLIATAMAWAESLSAAVSAQGEQAPMARAFTGAAWRVAADDLPIAGFAPPTRAKGGPAAMEFKRPEEVIGNTIAKHQAMRLARMLVAYDFDRMINPFVELGGFAFTFLGDGRPGTGKTTLIQMMAGLIHDYCGVAGYPFRYRNLSVDNVDSYQGKSGQNARAFVNAIIDPRVIGFGTIDDIDQIAGRRGDRQSSSGQQEITAVLMEAFAGASTVVRGNATFGMFSNHAENIDDALRQRAGARLLIEGPRTQADYIEILGLLMGRRHDIPIGSHDASRGRILQQAVSDSYAGHARPEAPAISAIFADVSYRHGPLQNISDLGSYLFAIAQADPRFTGRAIKNITDAVKARAMDFDMPDDWFDRPGTFLHQPYQRKIDMIEELRRPITPEMVLQEINRYADSEWRYSESADETAITDTVRGMQRMAEAKRRFERGD